MASLLLGALGKPEQLEQIFTIVGPPLFRQAMRLGHQYDVLPDREIGIDVGLLRHDAEMPSNCAGMGQQVVACNGYRACSGWYVTGEHPYGGAFTGAVGAEKAEYFTMSDRKVDPVN